MLAATLDVDLEVFQGPFDLLLTLVLKDELDLLEVDLAGVVLAYIDQLERAGQFDLEATTEFLVLIAALLELKSRLMLPGADDATAELEPAEAADELLARMLEYRRYRNAAAFLDAQLTREAGFRYRSAPPPKELRRVALELASVAYSPTLLGEAIGGLLRAPARLDVGHLARPSVSIGERLRHLRSLLAGRKRFRFDEAVAGADRVTQAVTLFALLELYKNGEARWEQDRPFGPITVRAGSS